MSTPTDGESGVSYSQRNNTIELQAISLTEASRPRSAQHCMTAVESSVSGPRSMPSAPLRPRGRGARDCDEYVSLSVVVCPLVYLKNHRQKIARFLYMYILWPWLGPAPAKLWYITYFRWITSNFHMTALWSVIVYIWAVSLDGHLCLSNSPPFNLIYCIFFLCYTYCFKWQIIFFLSLYF